MFSRRRSRAGLGGLSSPVQVVLVVEVAPIV